jgi:hypothetical protein
MLLVLIRAKVTLAVFVVVTLLYGSVCSTTCALGACPIETQNAATHDCDHSASTPTHHSAPQNPDCPQHHHPYFDAVRTDALSQSHFLSTNHVTATRLLAAATRNEAAGTSTNTLSPQVASPPNLSIPVSQQICELRI